MLAIILRLSRFPPSGFKAKQIPAIITINFYVFAPTRTQHQHILGWKKTAIKSVK
jgi:hypothetical protein